MASGSGEGRAGEPRQAALYAKERAEELVVKGMADILGSDEADLREKCDDRQKPV